MELSQAGNIELNEAAPWKQVKEDIDACEATLVTFLNLCLSLAVMMTPFLPKSSQKAWEYLNQEGKIDDNGWDSALDFKTEFKLQQPLPSVSYTHLTLPTIYSV